MELSTAVEPFTFHSLQCRLLAFVNSRIRNGELSERALALRLGVSQPQLHNVLKGARKLQNWLADAFLAEFAISVLDLLTAAELAAQENRDGDAFPSAEYVRLRRLRKQAAAREYRFGSEPIESPGWLANRSSKSR